jgi:hypothetical protein
VPAHADEHQRIAAGPGAETVGVHGFEVLKGFRADWAGGEECGEGGDGKQAKAFAHNCSVRLTFGFNCQGRPNQPRA